MTEQANTENQHISALATRYWISTPLAVEYDEETVTPQMMRGGVETGAKTSDFYRITNIPDRFNHPEWFQGYEPKKTNPMYITTATDYGGRPPTVHTMPTTFNGRTQKFTEPLGKCGMYRNHSLNTSLDKSVV